jgi:hypothetical protein
MSGSDAPQLNLYLVFAFGLSPSNTEVSKCEKVTANSQWHDLDLQARILLISFNPAERCGENNATDSYLYHLWLFLVIEKEFSKVSLYLELFLNSTAFEGMECLLYWI